MAASNPDWEQTVCSLARHLGKALGLVSTPGTEALLQKVTVVDDSGSFEFDSQADPLPNMFGTMVVLLLPPHTRVQATVHQGSQTLAVNRSQVSKLPLPVSPSFRLGGIAFSKGCKYLLQFTGSECYASMVYHLVQPTSQPAVVRDRAWFLSCFREIMESHSKQGPQRSFYLFEHKYDAKELTHAKKLRREHQSIAGLLWKAEQQDLIDVFLVRVTHHQWLVNALHNWDEEFEVADSETYVDDWRSLSGKKPGWTDEYTSHRDTILQGEDWLSSLRADREEVDERILTRCTNLDFMQMTWSMRLAFKSDKPSSANLIMNCSLFWQSCAV